MAANTIYLRNQEKIIELTEQEDKLKKDIAAEAKKITDAQKAGTDFTTQDLKNLKLKLKVKQDEKKVTQQIGDIHEEIGDEMDKEKLLSFDIKKNKAAQKKIEETIANIKASGTKADKKTLDILEKRKKAMDKMLDSTMDAAAAAQTQQQISEKLLGTLGLSVSALTSMKDQALLFGRALMTNPYLMIVGAFAAIAAYTIDMAKNTMTLSKDLGLSATQASKLNKELGFFDRKMLGFLGQDANAISKSIVDNFGDLGRFAEMSVKEIGFFSLGLGIAGEDAVKLARSMEAVLPNVSDGAAAMDKMQYYAGLAKANGVGTGVVLKDMADNTELFAEFGKDGGDNLAKAAVQARKLGLSLETTGKIANSLLDFESSIEKEMEASLMIGKQLNFNKARQLALEGDLAGAAKDVVSQIGGQAELNKMNVLQRRALADSIGVSVEEMSKLASGKLDIKSDNVDPIDAQTEAMKMLTETTGDLRTTLLKLIAPITILATAMSAIAPIIRGIAGKMGVPVEKLPKGVKPNKAPKIVKTKTGRFKAEGAKGPGFKTKRAAVQSIDDVIKATDNELLKHAGRASKIVKKIAVPVGVILDGAEVATVAMDKNKTKGDVAAKVAEKAGGWGGAAAGAAGGAAVGAMTGPAAVVMSPLLGLLGGIAGYFAGEEVTQTAIDKTAGMSSGLEADKGVSKVLEEFSDLDKEERAEFYNAMSGTQEQMNKFIEENSGLWSGFTDMGELVQVMQEVAKNTGKSVDEIANMTRE